MASFAHLEFEKPIIELENKIQGLHELSEHKGVNIADDVARLSGKLVRLLEQTYSHLTPAQKVQVARHPERPHALDYINSLIEEFTPLSGDRLFADDQALLGGVGWLRGTACVVMGQEKGKDTETRVKHNFGMAKPEGYRKAQRLLNLASRFNMPVITFVDTAGAYPGIDAEERGQAEAIAKSIETCLRCTAPIISVVIGEGGSGGAIAIATADKVMMLEHSVYSVISPEGCASILWRSASHAAEAAAALKLTAQDLLGLGIIDQIIPEPLGGAHRNAAHIIQQTGDAVEKALNGLQGQQGTDLIKARRAKYLAMGRNLPMV